MEILTNVLNPNYNNEHCTVSCSSRPWYLEASAPFTKNVVIVIDTSVFSQEFETVTQAVNTVLDSLGPHDRVSTTKDLRN